MVDLVELSILSYITEMDIEKSLDWLAHLHETLARCLCNLDRSSLHLPVTCSHLTVPQAVLI